MFLSFFIYLNHMDKRHYKIIFTLLIIIIVSGCPSVTGYYETFYTEGGVLQYYLKKTELVSGKTACTLDFTARIGKESRENSTINFTISTDSKENAESAWFTAGGGKLSVTDIEVLYIKRAEKMQRYSGSMTYNDFYMLMESEEPEFHVLLGSEEIIFESSKEFDQAREALFMEIAE